MDPRDANPIEIRERLSRLAVEARERYERQLERIGETQRLLDEEKRLAATERRGSE
jgi:hypothetical protein